MAAFAALALISMYAGHKMQAGKKLAPSPTAAGDIAGAGATAAGATTQPTPPTPPMSTAQATALNAGLGGEVAKKLRRKMGSNTGTRYSTPGQSLITPVTQPRSLIGS